MIHREVQWNGPASNAAVIALLGCQHSISGYKSNTPTLAVHTPAGFETIAVGDYVGRNVKGEVYVRKA